MKSGLAIQNLSISKVRIITLVSFVCWGNLSNRILLGLKGHLPGARPTTSYEDLGKVQGWATQACWVNPFLYGWIMAPKYTDASIPGACRSCITKGTLQLWLSYPEMETISWNFWVGLECNHEGPYKMETESCLTIVRQKKIWRRKQDAKGLALELEERTTRQVMQRAQPAKRGKAVSPRACRGCAAQPAPWLQSNDTDFKLLSSRVVSHQVRGTLLQQPWETDTFGDNTL